jgi:hypothetical protein
MTAAFGPERWAIEITRVLNIVLGPEHFPIDVIRVAREYTAQRFPGDAITMEYARSGPFRSDSSRVTQGVAYLGAELGRRPLP